MTCRRSVAFITWPVVFFRLALFAVASLALHSISGNSLFILLVSSCLIHSTLLEWGLPSLGDTLPLGGGGEEQFSKNFFKNFQKFLKIFLKNFLEIFPGWQYLEKICLLKNFFYIDRPWRVLSFFRAFLSSLLSRKPTAILVCSRAVFMSIELVSSGFWDKNKRTWSFKSLHFWTW